MASMKNQVTTAINEINQIGFSKRDAKMNQGDTSNLHSIKYLRDTLGTGIRFSEYCKANFGVKSIFRITSDHYKSYIQHITGAGSTVGNLINIESHLLKLQSGIEKLATKWGNQVIPFIEKRSYSSFDREAPTNRSYSQQEYNQISKYVSPNVQTAMMLSSQLGLRIKEVCNIRCEHIIEKDGRWMVKIENGKGVTKGGRFREIPIPSSIQKQVTALKQGKSPDQKLVKVKEGTLRSALKRACDKAGIRSKGWHGFRHSYARERLKEILGNRYNEAKPILNKMVENRKNQKAIGSNIPKSDQKLLQFIQEKINIVHAELGHGKARWGLVTVYMSDV